MTRSPTAQQVLAELEKHYDPPRTFLTWETSLDLLVATILSAQCTDARVNEVTTVLFQKCRTPEDYVALERSTLEDLIHSCGTFRNKAKFIQEMCQILIDDHDSAVPDTLDALTALPGVGKKTATIILWAVFGKNEFIAVDTHVMRLARRLGLSTKKDPSKIALDLMDATPRDRWGHITTLLISHGRAVCTARNRQCESCVFQENCPSSLTKGRMDQNKA